MLTYYQEFRDEEKTIPENNLVLARVGKGVVYGHIGMPETKDCIAQSTAASDTYIKRYCKRISAKEARKLHTELFSYLVQNGLLKG